MLVASGALVAGEVRVVRLKSALGQFVQGLHEKREKVHHPGLQHVMFTRVDVAPTRRRTNPSLTFDTSQAFKVC